MRLGGSGASPGNLSQLFSIVHEVAVEVFSDQDKPMTLNRWKLNRIDNIATGIWVPKACQCLNLMLWICPVAFLILVETINCLIIRNTVRAVQVRFDTATL